ncbi:MFS monocarboxylic acid transporter protein [Rutstroemia sp. NJR-2017a BVV2]|nr:MFS monocarboxylic acid transporter protein [Rutstroemia sp. NJR-2017a BVV2]
MAPTTHTPLLRSSSPASSTRSSSSSLFRNQNARKRDSIRFIAYASAILSCLCAGSITAYSLYGHLFQSRLHYTQLQVNIVIIAAELAMYLLVPLFGYLCDRVGPAPLSFGSGLMFGIGYTLAAFTYRSGAKDVEGYVHERGWPITCMVLAFTIIGMATTCMYISAVTACAKNFGKSKYRGLALACPIAAFGLSGMWQSQVASRILYERRDREERGDVDVFKFFVFLALTLFVVGCIGTVFLKIVDEEELIEEAVEELERSGLLGEGEGFGRGYGTLSGEDNGSDDADGEARKKTWLLNAETRRFLKDNTMWWLALGFFFVSGPGESFITNLGTIIGTLHPPTIHNPTSAATHVSVVALTSTIARILFGTLTDVLAPVPQTHHLGSLQNSLASLPPRPPTRRITISRVTFLIFSAMLILLGDVILASGAIQNHASRFWIVSTLIGSGYGALFSLTPLIVTVIWGVENFGTNWGIVAMVPALGATFWGVVYSQVYQRVAASESLGREVLCYGQRCYEGTFWAMAGSVAVGCVCWLWAWRGRGGWLERGVVV